MKREYRRHLPHQVPEGVPIFLTWNLKGAMPQEVLDRLEREREQLEREPPRQGEAPRERALRHGKLIFAKADECLDRASSGPLHLRDPVYAKIVEDSILFGASDRYELFAWCVMANHVHVLLTPTWKLAKVTQGIKGFTSWKINQLRVGQAFQPDSFQGGQPGKADVREGQTYQSDSSNTVRLESLTYESLTYDRTFWQDESYDHWARDEEELLRIIHYIENNPVKVGLCQRPQDWRWSSARLRANWPAGQPFQK
jgi:REP-associated tyrosine transposase